MPFSKSEADKINGLIESFKGGYTTLTEEQVKYARAILSSNNDLLALINDILDLSRIEAGRLSLEPAPLRFADLLQELADMHSKGILTDEEYAQLAKEDAAAPAETSVWTP